MCKAKPVATACLLVKIRAYKVYLQSYGIEILNTIDPTNVRKSPNFIAGHVKRYENNDIFFAAKFINSS